MHLFVIIIFIIIKSYNFTTALNLKFFTIVPYTEDKFYSRPGSHVAVHGGAIPIQQPPQVFDTLLII
jgi:hypothetical protein